MRAELKHDTPASQADFNEAVVEDLKYLKRRLWFALHWNFAMSVSIIILCIIRLLH